MIVKQLSKTEEKELFVATVDALPDGYVRDILTSQTAAVFSAIDADLGYIDLHAAQKEVMAARAELAQIDKQKAERETQLARLEAELKRARAELKLASENLVGCAGKLKDFANDLFYRSAMVSQTIQNQLKESAAGQ